MGEYLLGERPSYKLEILNRLFLITLLIYVDMFMEKFTFFIESVFASEGDISLEYVRCAVRDMPTVI